MGGKAVKAVKVGQGEANEGWWDAEVQRPGLGKSRSLGDFERTRLLGGLVNGLIGPRGRIGPMFEADVAE